MARGAASPGGDSSSSGFSSDEDMADMSELPLVVSLAPTVHVDVLDEAEESGPNSAVPAASEAPADASDVLQCCQDVADPILRSSKPLDVQYEQFTAAIGHVMWHFPSSETVPDAVELAKRLRTYHSLRAELYKTFQRVFPLTEDMFSQWIADCGAKGDTTEELKQLFELSQGDYWSVPLTLQCLRFIKDNGDAAELQEAMTKAQKTLGMHFARGHEVWALCRELTTEQFEEMDGDVELQKEKAIRELFCKQMQLPLDQNDLVMSEFRAWDVYNRLDAEASGSVFEDASKRQNKLFAPLMKKLRGFEARVNAAPGTEDAAAPEQAWQQYLNFVKHRVAPLMSADKVTGSLSKEGRQLVTCLYERAVSVMCLSPTLWASYLEFLNPDQTDDGQTSNNEKLVVARRAVRNVPFDSSAWVELLLQLELQGKLVEENYPFIRTELLARANAPMDQFHLLNVLLAWCDAVRRHVSSVDGETLEDIVQQVETLIGTVFSECEQFMSKAYPDFLEGRMRLTEYKAKIYWALMPPQGTPRLAPATAMKVSRVCAVWKKMLKTPLGEQATAWIAYLEATQRMSAFTPDSIRAMVFDEAVQRVKDAPLALAEAWLIFERENGDLSSYFRARLYHAKHRHAAQATPASKTATPIANSAPVESDNKSKNPKKRKATEGKKQAKGSQKQPVAKRIKPNVSDAKEDGATAMEVDEPKAAMKLEKKVQHESLTNEHTLFLCNVSKDASKGDIEAMFRDIHTLKDVRLVVKTRGDRVKSRGMAYVQFTDDAGVEAGLKRDGFLLHGHPLRVERSKPPPSSASVPSGKLAQGGESFWKTDPLTLYVGNLNREGSKEQLTEQQLQESLQQAMLSLGELVVVTRVSILKDRHGKLKNYGLVEVAEPSQVTFCLNNVAALQSKLGEQVTLKPSRFSIAHILEQQEKQQKQKQHRKAGAPAPSGRGGAAKGGANAPHSRPSTRLALPTSGSATSLMPRALRRKLAAQDAAAKTKSDPSGTTVTVTPKSNEDFRKMLFNK